MIERASTAAAQRRTALPCAPVLVLCVALAACGDLPRPFQPAEKNTQAWSAPGDLAWGSILVQPIAGLSPPQSAALAGEIVAALQVRDVPASTHVGGRGSIVLAGQVSAVTGKLRWSLVTPDGKTAFRFEEALLDAARLDEKAPDLAAIAARAARRLTAALEPPATEDAVARPAVPVVLEAVHGAPGNGGVALARAMRHSLVRIGIAVADDSEDDRHVILGRVSLARDETATDDATLTIAWDVLQPDGTRLGTVTQSNRVSAEQLTGAWGALAGIVARAGAPAIAQLLAHAEAPRMAGPTRHKVAVEPPIRTLTEASPAPAKSAAGALPPPAIAMPIEPPIALAVEAHPARYTPMIEARAAPPEPPAEAPPTPLFRPLPTPPAKPRPEAPIAVSIVVSAALR